MRRSALVLVPTLALTIGIGATWASIGGSNDAAGARSADTAGAPAERAVDASPEAGTVAATAEGAAPEDCRSFESADRDITRLSGFDRYATAACASAVGYPLGVATVVLARGDAEGQYADALAGTVLAHAVGGPVLLTAPDRLPDSTAQEIERLGAEHVILLGGETAISPQVVQQVEALGVTTERVAGDGRATTAARASERAGATGVAFVVNGYRPADALVAGAVAARAGGSLLLVGQDAVPQVTLDALQDVAEITIVGGHGVVTSEVEAQLRARVGAVTRLSGPTRDETAASVARARPADGTVHLVSGANESLVDAIAAGWLAARPGGGPVLYSLSETPGRGTDRYLRIDGLSELPPVRLLGGETVLTPALVDAVEQRLDEAEAGGLAPQTRAMWVHLFDRSLKSREAIARTLDTAVAHNLNTVVAQVVRRHDSYSTSDALPRTSDPHMPDDLDLLAELTTQAHARGLELHAWVVVANAWHSAYGSPSDLPPTHIYRTHGPGTPESWMTRAQDGTWSTQYLDVGVPAFQDHVVALTADIARRYPVDAVHLDYIRYPEGGQWGYNPIAVEQWRRDGSPDFADWRRAQTEKLTARVKEAVGAARPGTLVSMAAIAQGDGPSGVGGFHRTRAYAQTYQDWAGWLQRGVVDVVYPMAYMREDGSTPGCTGSSSCEHARWYDNWVDFAATLAPDHEIAIGQGSYLNTVGQSLSQLGQALSGTDGVVLYSYQMDTRCPAGRTESGSACSPTEPHGSLLAALRDGPFATPAPAR